MKKLFTLVLLFVASMTQYAAAQTALDSIEVEGVRIPVVDKMHVEQTRFGYNWYWGIQAGVLQSWGSNTSNLGLGQKLNPTISLTLGKEITPISEARFELFYGRNTGYKDEKYNWNTAGLYVAYLPNLTNLFWGYGERRSWNLKAVIGAGLESGWGFSNNLEKTYEHGLFLNSLIGLEAGLHAAFRLNDRMKFTVEATEHFLDDSFDRNRDQADHTWDGHLNVKVGITYHIGEVYHKRHFQHVRNDMTLYAEQQKELDDLREKADSLRKNPNVVSVPVEVNKDIVYTLIAFDPKTTTVDRLQQANIFTTAKIWETRPDSYIYITNSTGENDKLFRDRAESIKRLLKERYNISDSNIKIEASEADVRKGKTQTSIIFIVNE